MVAKKIIVWGGSGAFGLVAGFGTVFALGTTVQKYAVDLNFGVLDLVINNLFFLCLAYAAFVWIWLDISSVPKFCRSNFGARAGFIVPSAAPLRHR